jgi:uncharacterized protein
MTNDFPERLRGLLRPAAYPHPVGAIELVQTHMSWVLLTGEFAYKLKRPVHYPFVDLSTAERREFSCREELRLNRRFAPELYLDVCAITAANGAAQIGGEGATIEHVVKMLQFERATELDQLLAAQAITPGELEAFGRQLVTIHARLPRIAPTDPWGRPQNVQAIILRNVDDCAAAAARLGSRSDLGDLRAVLAARLSSLADCMAERRAAGWVRECHGDLHSGNIVRRGARLVAFDCMEFEVAFRWIDVADEVAFLLSDVAARGRALHARAFVGGYLAQGGDYQACRLFRAYQAHRALVRAKIAALNAASARNREFEEFRATFTRLAHYAAAVLNAPRPRLLLIFGLSGAGKTWLAQQLAERLGAIHLRSDVERKRLAGLAENARSSSALGQDLYSGSANMQVYAKLRRDADEVLGGGYDVIVDATFGRREDRTAFRQLAERLGISIWLINCHAPVEILRARIKARRSAEAEASEADERVLEWQIEHHDALDADEGMRTISVDTTHSAALEQVISELDARCAPI